MQIHGAGFGHFNFDPATPELSKHFRVVDYDMRGYGASDRPVQDYDMEVWADDLAGLMDALEIDQAHVHGTSMGGMIAIVFAGKYPERTTSVVINCAAAKLGVTGRLIFKNWIDIARMDPDGPGSRVLAELITWQALSKRFLEEQNAEELTDLIQQILRDSNRIEVFTAACQAMCDMDLTEWLPKITSPALVLGGDEDVMTPWDQGPGGVGQQGIYEGIEGAEKHVIRGSNHSTIFDGTEEHNRVVIDFFRRHSARLRQMPTVEEYGVEPIPQELQDGGLARPLRHQLHVLPQPRHVRARRPRRRRRWSAAVVGGARDGGRPGARLRDAVHRRPAGRGLRADGARADAVAPRLLGLAPVVVSVPRDRRDVLVRGAGADGSARDPGALRRDDRRPAAARPARPLPRRGARGARNPRVRRHAVAAEGRAADLARVDRDASSCCSSATDDPDYAVARVFDSPDQQLTWTGFATYVTVMCGASLTLVANISDFCRYTPTRRDMRIGLAGSALAAAVVTTFVGGYAAAATGETNPFIAVADLVSSDALLVVLMAAIVLQGLAANIMNVYTAGLSLVNTVPRLGRLVATHRRRRPRRLAVRASPI